MISFLVGEKEQMLSLSEGLCNRHELMLTSPYDRNSRSVCVVRSFDKKVCSLAFENVFLLSFMMWL